MLEERLVEVVVDADVEVDGMVEAALAEEQSPASGPSAPRSQGHRVAGLQEKR